MDNSQSIKFENLRKQAEKLIQQQPNIDYEQPDNIMDLIQELRLHQAELEIQNEELQRAQKELAALHKKYESLYELAPCGYITLTPDRIITHANLKAVALLEQPRQYIINKGFSSFIAKGFDQIFLTACQKAGQTDEKHCIEFPLRNENTESRWVRADIEADRDKNEIIIQFRMTMVDITEDRANKEAYKQKATEMEALFNGTKLLLEDNTFENNARKIFDICRELTGAQSGYVALLSENGAENEVLFLESGGLPCDVNPALPMPIRGLREEAYKTGKAVFDNSFSTSKWMKFMPKGHVKLKNVLFAPLKNNGSVIGLIGLANKHSDFIQNDLKIVTALGELAAVSLKQSLSKAALQESESQLRQAQKMEAIGTLAGGIAHDFNNMLGVIIGNSSYAIEMIEKYDNDELYSVLFDIEDGAKRAQNLTQQLLTFSKGGSPIKKTADLNQLIKESALFVTRGAKSKCRFDLSKSLWAAEVDAGQLNQAINNLVINSSQSMPNGGTIMIRTDNTEIEEEDRVPLPAGKYIYIEVKDRGTGIPEDHISKIFDPYFTTKQEGSGLGLTTTYSIIKQHGGLITINSLLGEGTTVNIYLPASEKEQKPPVKQAGEVHKGQGKILVMDDQEPILKMLKRQLTRMGYEAFLAEDGAQAIDIFREAYKSNNPFDLVILDLTIPGGMGGAKTIPELLKIDPKVKAIVSSGYSNDPIMAHYQDYGFCGVIPKGFTMNQISKVIKDALGKKD